MTAEFSVNNKTHIATKISSFIANYGRELRMREDIRKKGKIESAMEFVERMKKVHEEVGAALRKIQEEMKRYVDQNRKEIEEERKGDRVMLSTKDLVFKERPVQKLTERYVGLYEIEEIVLLNAVKLQLPSLMRIHPVVNVSWIVWYKEQVKGQKKEEEKPVEVEGVEEWEMERILNKKKIRGIKKYLAWWKGFTAEHNSWVKKEELENSKEVLAEFKGRIEAEVRRQEKIDRAEERDFRREELPGKFMARMLYGWNDRKFEEEYLKKLERNWRRWKAVSLEEKP